MKSNFKLLLPLAGLGALIWAGCQTQAPTSYSHVISSAGTVVDFEGASPLNVNPGLAEANRPGNIVIIPGAVGLLGATTAAGTGTVVSPGASNTNFCYHASGAVTDLGNATYPSIQVQIPLEKSASVSAFYDTEFFRGVKFYVRVMSDDSVGVRRFSIPVAQTQPPSAGGDCNPGAASNSCYNDFAVSYPNTGGNWILVSNDFSAFARGNYGAAISPTTLSGLNLQQILMLDWTETNQNVPGTATVDFYIDEVQFY